MTTEYALLRCGRIVNVVMTTQLRSAVQQRYPQYIVMPLNDVPLGVCEQYQYWSDRP